MEGYTLDSAGHTYNPFTTVDIFGTPPQVHNKETAQQQLFVGRDDSALPALANPHFQNPGYVTGSNQYDAAAANRLASTSRNAMRTNDNTVYLVLFVAVIGLALMKIV